MQCYIEAVNGRVYKSHRDTRAGTSQQAIDVQANLAKRYASQNLGLDARAASRLNRYFGV